MDTARGSERVTSGGRRTCLEPICRKCPEILFYFSTFKTIKKNFPLPAQLSQFSRNSREPHIVLGRQSRNVEGVGVFGEKVGLRTHSLEDKLRRQTLLLEKLQRENRYLKRRLDNLHKQVALSKRRTISECSTNTISSISTNLSTGSPSISESDEVDVIGYTSNQSDTDDHSSVQSSSDSGVAMSTSRLTLSEMEIF
ncbi:hypothetical protein RUM43_007833 [Polyplax serrata]|uniref:Uncharacterized protein n=1 Tax=Polyplax serrata TaxID=468196 RepID=A0AAN8P9C7_POLSC